MPTTSDENQPEQERLVAAFFSLVELIAKLRSPEGCPWDVRQTEESVKIYVLEEAYEVLDAIERASSEDLCSELGDLLFQILFLARMAEEKSNFTLIQVFEKITKKMIHRHPHVFGSTTVRNAEEVAENWDKIKKQERGAAESSPKLLMDVPAGLPALLRAHRLIERAGRLNSSQGQGERILKNAEETFRSLRENVDEKNKEAIGDDIGTFLFHLADLARHWGLNAESLLRKANDRFLNSFQKGEEL
jgi:tetrapyrrole methylase family protein / MazG family protein